MIGDRSRISIIAAMTDDRVIGIDNRLPWRLPADLAHFKQVTMGKPMLMGRKTWESLPGLLPGRIHIVITRDPGYHASGALIANSIESALRLAGEVEEIMVVGGANLYAQMLPLANRMYLSEVHADIEGDAWFPEFDRSEWMERERVNHAADERNSYPYSFVLLERLTQAAPID